MNSLRNLYLIAIPIFIGLIAGVYITNESTSDFVTTSSLTHSMLTKNGSPIMGESNAKITIVEFGDYQCTFCYKFHKNTLNEIYNKYIQTGQIKYVYKDYPLNGSDSILAAEASYCADDQNKYWLYHDELFENWAGEKTGWINKNSLMKFALDSDLNISEFNKCLNEHKYYQKVINNQNYAKSIEINATPSFLIFNDQEVIRIVGAQPLEKFEDALNQLN